MKQRMVDLNREFYKPKINNFDDLIRNCESPIEERFIGHLSSQLDANAQVTGQFNVAGKRADFLIESAGMKTVIECDGREFHNYREDVERDLHILENSSVDRIIRFRGCDIVFQMHKCIKAMQDWVPEAFGEPTGNIIAANVHVSGTCKPIIRAKVKRQEIYERQEHIRMWRLMEVLQSFGATADGVGAILQFKATDWSRDLGSEAGRVHRLGDVLMDILREEYPQ